MQTFVGYPVRILTAAIVRDGLAIFGVPSIGIDTILVFENGISQVDLPCSGVKSLWTGGLFLLAATWIENRTINLRWFAVAFGFTLLLLSANLVRVGVLISVGEVAGWRLLAEMLHVPLGVLGFTGACAAAVTMLHWAGKTSPDRVSEAVLAQDSAQAARMGGWQNPITRPNWLVPLLVSIVLALTFLYTPRPEEIPLSDILTWTFSSELDVQAWPLSVGEIEWLGSGGALAGDRWRFSSGDITGSMLFVTSNSWRAHHRPERCFEVYGLEVENYYSYLLDPEFPVRLLTLGDGDGRALYTAIYWLQSPNQVTDDYATRIWADFAPKRQTWVLVTILLDRAYDPLAPDVQALYPALRQAVAIRLEGGGVP